MILTEVNIYVKAPPGVKAAQIVCNISPRKLELGIRGSDRYFISEATYSLVDTSESSWYMDDDIINIVLIKAHRATLVLIFEMLSSMEAYLIHEPLWVESITNEKLAILARMSNVCERL